MVQGGLAITIGDIDVSSGLHEHAHNVTVSRFGYQEERDRN